MKKEFACNGTVVSSVDSDEEDSPAPTAPGAKTGAKPDFGKVLQFQGDQRIKVKDFLVMAGVVSEKEAKDKVQMWVSAFRSCSNVVLLCRLGRRHIVEHPRHPQKKCITEWKNGIAD